MIPFQYGVPEPGLGFRPSADGCDLSRIGGGACTHRMSQQPEMISPSMPASPAPKSGQGLVAAPALQSPETGSVAATGKRGPNRLPRWLEKAELLLRVLLRMYIGLAVCYAPWSHLFWDQNPLFLQFPTLSIYAANGAVRGIVSGLGLLNLWMAFRDAIRHGADQE